VVSQHVRALVVVVVLAAAPAAAVVVVFGAAAAAAVVVAVVVAVDAVVESPRLHSSLFSFLLVTKIEINRSSDGWW